MMLEDKGREALAAMDPTSLVAVAVIGLSRFAEVNDLLGAHAADEMLRAVADRLTSVVRRCDVVARLHGAEYVLLLRELRISARPVRRRPSSPFDHSGRRSRPNGLDLTVDAHTGVACAPDDGDNHRRSDPPSSARDVPGAHRRHAGLPLQAGAGTTGTGATRAVA